MKKFILFFVPVLLVLTSTSLAARDDGWKIRPAKNTIGIAFGDVSGGFTASYERRWFSNGENMQWTVRVGWGTYGETSDEAYNGRSGWLAGGGVLLGKYRWQWHNEMAWMCHHTFSTEGDLALMSGVRRQVARGNAIWRFNGLYLPYSSYPAKFGWTIGFGVGF